MFAHEVPRPYPALHPLALFLDRLPPALLDAHLDHVGLRDKQSFDGELRRFLLRLDALARLLDKAVLAQAAIFRGTKNMSFETLEELHTSLDGGR